jgi:hypothetical protein
MKKQKKILMLFCAAAVAAVVFLFQFTTKVGVAPAIPREDSPGTRSQYPSATTQTSGDQARNGAGELSFAELESLKIIGDGLRSLKSEDRFRLAKAGNEAMESFLTGWNPIGRTSHELKAVFGQPKQEGSDFLLYAFDNGWFVWLYKFGIRDGRVVELTRPPSE